MCYILRKVRLFFMCKWAVIILSFILDVMNFLFINNLCSGRMHNVLYFESTKHKLIIPCMSICEYVYTCIIALLKTFILLLFVKFNLLHSLWKLHFNTMIFFFYVCICQVCTPNIIMTIPLFLIVTLFDMIMSSTLCLFLKCFSQIIEWKKIGVEKIKLYWTFSDEFIEIDQKILKQLHVESSTIFVTFTF